MKKKKQSLKQFELFSHTRVKILRARTLEEAIRQFQGHYKETVAFARDMGVPAEITDKFKPESI